MSILPLSAAAQIHSPSSSSSSSAFLPFTRRFPSKFTLNKSPNPNLSIIRCRSIFTLKAAFGDELEAISELEYEVDEEEQQLVTPSSQSSSELGRLYVGNLPYSMTADQLKEVFGEAGRVASAEIVYDRVTDRSRGFAFVTMANVDDANEAIRMYDGAQIGGRTVKVNFPEVPRGGEREVMGPKIRNSYKGFVDSPHKVYAGNLSWDLTSQQLRDIFADQPGLLGAKVVYDRDTGRSRGFGFVTFTSAEEVQASLNALNGKEIEGRPLRLNVAAERARPVESNNNLSSGQLLSTINSLG